MTRNGRAGAALAVAAMGSFVAGSLGVVGIVLAASWLADQALRFGPPEYFAMAAAGLLLLSRLSGGSVMHAFLMVAIGLALGTVGMEPISAVRRFTFGSTQLSQGIELVPVIMGLYGVAEVLLIAESGIRKAHIATVRLRELLPTRAEWKRSAWPIARGSAVGFLTGLIPGPATVLSTFIAYKLERKISKTPERFGHGAIEGVAGPEAANNGATAGAMVPLLSLGIPFSPATAILLGALIITGIQPGPLLISQRPEVFWGVVASMYVGNLILLVLNLPLVGLFVSVLRLAAARAGHAGPAALPGGRLQPQQQPARPLGARRLRDLRLRAAQARHRSVARSWSRSSWGRSWRRHCGRRSSWSAVTSWRSSDGP